MAPSAKVEVSHPERVLFPDDGITKADLVGYYQRVAERMLPWLRGRPLVLHRFPDGIGGSGFYQKEAASWFPDWIRTVDWAKEGGTVRHVVADDADTLAYVANLGTITPHVLLSTVDRPRQPDQLILDLDPGPGGTADVVLAARATRQLLDEVGLVSFVKSTGSRGLHIHVPLDEQADFDRVGAVALGLAGELVDRHPDRFTVAHRKAGRGDRLFLDTLRNGYGQHAVAPFAVRPLPGAPVAVPLDWDEATRTDFDPARVTVGNVFRRLGRKADPWDGWDQARQTLDSVRMFEA